MKRNNLIDPMEHLDDRFITEAAPKNAAPMTALRKKVFLRWGAMAACFFLAVILAAQAVLPLLQEDPAFYTAAEIADLFGTATAGTATSVYKEVYAPSPEYLYLQPLPETEDLTIYAYTPGDKMLDPSEFSSFLEPAVSSFFAAIGEEAPSYEIKTDTLSTDDSLRSSLIRSEKCSFIAEQSGAYNYCWFTADEMALNGISVTVDQAQTDEEIIASLSAVKEQLFSIFGVEFSDVKIYRLYNSYSDHGVSWLNVYFYPAHPLNSTLDNTIGVPASDYIQLDFRNSEGTANDTVLRSVGVAYFQHREDLTDIYTPSKTAKMISLKEAEALLYKGYVFGNPVCPVCMAAQPKVDFEGYDHVGFAYIRGYSEVIPFYVFYQHTGTAKNGNQIYAKTYVPAIKVSGYAAYFESHTADHADSTNPEAD